MILLTGIYQEVHGPEPGGVLLTFLLIEPQCPETDTLW